MQSSSAVHGEIYCQLNCLIKCSRINGPFYSAIRITNSCCDCTRSGSKKENKPAEIDRSETLKWSTNSWMSTRDAISK